MPQFANNLLYATAIDGIIVTLKIMKDERRELFNAYLESNADDKTIIRKEMTASVKEARSLYETIMSRPLESNI
jgi:hypothetical protein